MKSLRSPLQVFALLSILVHGLWACAGIGIADPTPTPTTVVVLPLDQAGVVNADTVPVRQGPGADFELAVLINLDYTIEVVGQSEDGAWYKVEIPGFTGDQSNLWIAVDFVNIIPSTGTPSLTPVVFEPSPTATGTGAAEGSDPSSIETAAIDTLPAPTLAIATTQPSSSCSPPLGWIRYVVQPGDTLFDLAGRTNTSVDQIMQANCLTDSQITAGTPLYLPFAPPVATSIPLQTPTVTRTIISNVTSTATPSITYTPLPEDTVTPTATGTIIKHETPTDTSTVIVTQQWPPGTQGTQNP